MNVYRVTVRGQFSGLTDRARRYLAAAVDDHDVMRSGFSEDGTLSYDASIRFFNLRYEVRLESGDGRDPAEVAIGEAERFLRTMGFGHGALRAAVMDMSEVVGRARNR